MSKRSANIVILCEDLRHYNFVRRFLADNGWDTRRIRRELSSGGSAEQFVREQFPKELRAYRSRQTFQQSALLVVIDADTREVADRMADFRDVCTQNDISFRQDNEVVVFVIPKRNIETWFTYLDGNSVDEQTDYKDNIEGKLTRFPKALKEKCRTQTLQPQPPPSLTTACAEYERFKH